MTECILIHDITRRCKDMNFIFEWLKQIFYELAQRMNKILFSPRESSNRRTMFCLLLYNRKQLKIQISNIRPNFGLIMLKT